MGMKQTTNLRTHLLVSMDSVSSTDFLQEKRREAKTKLFFESDQEPLASGKEHSQV